VKKILRKKIVKLTVGDLAKVYLLWTGLHLVNLTMTKITEKSLNTMMNTVKDRITNEIDDDEDIIDVDGTEV